MKRSSVSHVEQLSSTARWDRNVAIDRGMVSRLNVKEQQRTAVLLFAYEQIVQIEAGIGCDERRDRFGA